LQTPVFTFQKNKHRSNNDVVVSFLEFLKADIAGSYSPPQNVYLQRDRVQHFLATPFMVEKVCIQKYQLYLLKKRYKNFILFFSYS